MNNEEKPKKNPLQTGGSMMRQIDKLASESLPFLGKSWTFVARTRVKTWQGLFMLAFVSGAFVSFVWSVSLEIESLSKASGQAALSMTSDQASGGVVSVAQDETFNVDLVLDTGGVDVVAARAIVTYNPSDFHLNGWDTSNSIFTVSGNTCTYQSGPCQIVDDDATNGRISITMARPSPGVNTHSGIMATLTFQALRSISPSTDNILYTFLGADNATDSDVIESGSTGNDLLNSASGIRVVVGAPLCTGYTYSNWGVCQSNGTQTRTVVSSVPEGCSGGEEPVLSQPCDYTPPTCTRFDYSPWGDCQQGDTQTRTVIASYPENCEGEPNPNDLVQACDYDSTEACTSYNYGEWGPCQSDGTQTRTAVGVPEGCSGGVEPVISQTCTPSVTCTSFEYSNWTKCRDGKQTRSITNSLPAGCTGGSPVVERTCGKRKVRIMDTTVSFSDSEKILTSSKTISFSGSDEELKSGGKVEIYREGKLKTTESVGGDGSWSTKVKESKGGTYEYRIRYVGASGNEIEKSSEYQVKVDSEDPEITDLPLFLMKARGEKVWWEAKDNDEMDHYRYVFLGQSKSTKSKSFNIPANAPTGLHTFQLTAYDEAGNRTVKRILIRVR